MDRGRTVVPEEGIAFCKAGAEVYALFLSLGEVCLELVDRCGGGDGRFADCIFAPDELIRNCPGCVVKSEDVAGGCPAEVGEIPGVCFAAVAELVVVLLLGRDGACICGVEAEFQSSRAFGSFLGEDVDRGELRGEGARAGLQLGDAARLFEDDDLALGGPSGELGEPSIPRADAPSVFRICAGGGVVGVVVIHAETCGARGELIGAMASHDAGAKFEPGAEVRGRSSQSGASGRQPLALVVWDIRSDMPWL